MTDAEDMVAFRIPVRDRAAIQQLVDQGHFQNRSDFFRHAVKSALQAYGSAAGASPSRTPVPPELPDLEGISLPDDPTSRASRAAPRARKGVNL